MSTDRAAERNAMVEDTIARRGILDRHILEAMRAVPREAFVPAELAPLAYHDAALAIESGQTISQPYVVAWMIAEAGIEAGHRVLEIGTGSGYAAAVLSLVAGEVYTIERVGQLARRAADRLERLGYRNVHVRHGDGTLGWPDEAPFDAALIAAAAAGPPPAVLEQLRDGGRLVMPVGSEPHRQWLTRWTRRGLGDYVESRIGAVAFVPLVSGPLQP